MKYLNDWRLFETKLSELFDALSKDNPDRIDSILKPHITGLFMRQFVSYLKKKLPKKFIDDYLQIYDWGWIEFKFPDGPVYISDIVIKTEKNRILMKPEYDQLTSTELSSYRSIINAINTKKEFFFKETFLDSIWQKYQGYVASYITSRLFEILNVDQKIDKPTGSPSETWISTARKPTTINLVAFDKKYFSNLKKCYPEFLYKVAEKIKDLSPKQLNLIRTNFPTLFQEMKSLQRPEDQWSTDLQADAGEYGL